MIDHIYIYREHQEFDNDLMERASDIAEEQQMPVMFYHYVNCCEVLVFPKSKGERKWQCVEKEVQ